MAAALGAHRFSSFNAPGRSLLRFLCPGTTEFSVLFDRAGRGGLSFDVVGPSTPNEEARTSNLLASPHDARSTVLLGVGWSGADDAEEVLTCELAVAEAHVALDALDALQHDADFELLFVIDGIHCR